MAISFLMIMIAMAVTLACILLIRSDENEEEEYTYTSEPKEFRPVDNGVCFIRSITPSYGETQEAFEERLLKQFSIFEFEDLGAYSDSDYDDEYYIAGVKYHVSDPCVTFGIATRDKYNKYSSRAVAIVTYEGRLIGYIPEKSLNRWYEDTEGKDMPVIIFCYRQEGQMLGSIYVYQHNAANYPRMVNKYLKCLKMHS